MSISEIFQIITLVTGVIYVILEILQKNSMWILGVVTSLATMVVFFIERDVPSLVLYTYYTAISFYGLYQWRQYKSRPVIEGVDSKPVIQGVESKPVIQDADTKPVIEGDSKSITEGGESQEIVLRKLTRKDITLGIALFVAGLVLFPEILKSCGFWKGGFAAELEVVIVVMSAVATYWLSKAFIAQWFLWIIANGLYVWFCIIEGMWWMAAMYVAYVFSAVYGYIHWKKYGHYVD